ncbi:MAG: hypothetical protein FWD33_02690 [Alphaproteobacteria bacterium]|nr:hypothetical protein [Alphaproteobacteria bacterium]
MAKVKSWISILGGFVMALLFVNESDANVRHASVSENRIVYRLSDLEACRDRTSQADIRNCMNFTAAQNASRDRCQSYGWPDRCAY